jgi:uncharacterized RDD family membrane protein YckC
MTNPAGFWVRFFAGILDGLIICLPLSIISYLIIGEFEENSFTWVANTMYSLILPIFWYGYTIGKKLMGVRIAKLNGEKLGFGTMLLRVLVGNLLYIVTLGIGVIVSAFMVGLREDKRSLHDLIAGTYVTYNPPEIMLESEES